MKSRLKKIACILLPVFSVFLVMGALFGFSRTPEKRYRLLKNDLTKIFQISVSDEDERFSCQAAEDMIREGFFKFYPAAVSALRSASSDSFSLSKIDGIVALLLFYADLKNPATEREAAIAAFFYYLPVVLSSPQQLIDISDSLKQNLGPWKNPDLASRLDAAVNQLVLRQIFPAIKSNPGRLKEFESFFSRFPEAETIIKAELESNTDRQEHLADPEASLQPYDKETE